MIGSNSPSRFRREGREAFELGVDPLDVCPYNKNTFWDKSHKGDWLKGWKQAEDSFEETEETEEYMVIATYPDETGQEEVGTLTLRTINSCHDMPIELEIDGVTYYPQF